MQFLLDPLRPRAEVFQLAPALGADRVHTARMAAVMAHQPAVRAVVGQRDAAVRALVGEAAVRAADELVRAAAVDEEDALLAALEVELDLGAELLADVACVPAPELALHVHDADLRQLLIVVALVETEEGIASDLGVVAALHVRRGRAED